MTDQINTYSQAKQVRVNIPENIAIYRLKIGLTFFNSFLKVFPSENYRVLYIFHAMRNSISAEKLIN
jgi:hypothetical protein